MIKDASLFFIVILAIVFGWLIIRRKRQQQKPKGKAIPEDLLCVDCGSKLKLVNGTQEFYECPKCSNLYQEPDNADKKEQ